MDFIIYYDNFIFTLINAGLSNSFFDLIMPWITHLADASVVWILVVLIGIISGWRFAQSARVNLSRRQQNVIIAKAVLFFCIYTALICVVNGGIYTGIKSLSNRSRPFVHQTVTLRVSPEMVSNQKTSSSFPSGHASNAFMLAALFAELFRRKRAFFYGLAAMIALSRVYLGVHYPSDVVVGGILGLITASVMIYIRPVKNNSAHDSYFLFRKK